MSGAPTVSQEGPLAVVCGGGSLPLTIADLVAARGRKVVLFPLRGFSDPAIYGERPHHWIYFGQWGRAMRIAGAAGCRDIVFIGSVVRPSLWQLRPDLTGLMLMARIAATFRGGDDHLLSGIARLVEEKGYRLVGAHEVAPEILVPEGALGHVQPSDRDRADIAFGLEYLRASGPFDVGQAVVVASKHVLAVEALEGTDQMLLRVAEMRAKGRLRAPAGTGVLVKAPKPNQDRRFDLPSIGPRTAEGVMRASLAGIAVIAGQTLVAEAERLVETADRSKIFVVGVPAGTAQ